MAIIFKPNGSLDIDTDPADLPQEVDGVNIVSAALKRCKNLRMDERGVLRIRDGSYKLNDTALVGTMDFLIVQGGHRYAFGGIYVYRDETLITAGIQCSAPEFSPAAGSYSSSQTVTISSDTVGATIYYTIDGTTPSASSEEYTSSITVPLLTTLKAIAIREGFADSDVTSGYYTATQLDFTTETDANNMITETDGNDFIGEGVS